MNMILIQIHENTIGFLFFWLRKQILAQKFKPIKYKIVQWAQKCEGFRIKLVFKFMVKEWAKMMGDNEISNLAVYI